MKDQEEPEWDESVERPGTRLVKRDIAWKVCDKGKDVSLRDLSPDVWLAMSDSLHPRLALLGFAAKRAYPRLDPQVAVWSEVEEDWKAGALKKLPEVVREAIKAREPIIIEEEVAGLGSQVILHGPSDVYFVRHAKEGRCPHGRVFCHQHESLKTWPGWLDKRGSEL